MNVYSPSSRKKLICTIFFFFCRLFYLFEQIKKKKKTCSPVFSLRGIRLPYSGDLLSVYHFRYDLAFFSSPYLISCFIFVLILICKLSQILSVRHFFYKEYYLDCLCKISKNFFDKRGFLNNFR